MRLWMKQTSLWTICARKRCTAHQSLGLLACCVQGHLWHGICAVDVWSCLLPGSSVLPHKQC